ncbi:MAG TPA: type II toxin-antitoxin system RelE/ParE family toxin, partial [Luteimonas sp.]
RAWGQPPGTMREQHAPVDAGRAPTQAVARGRGRQVASAEPNMQAGGFQVVYDLVSETRLRGWRDEGMTEVSLPLPGVRQLMVCPLETALRRESGPCRLVEPDDPELARIGDAREVIAMNQVYRRGELVWRGPGPYR